MEGPNPERVSAAPAGWYPDPTTGQNRYWNGSTWLLEGAQPASDELATAAAGRYLAAELRRQAWWRVLAATVVGSAVGIIVLASDTSTVVWWGGYLVAGSLAWHALKKFRMAGELMGTGVGTEAWLGLGAGAGLVALLGVQAFSYWTSPPRLASGNAVGTCWASTAGSQVERVDCDSFRAAYKVTGTAANQYQCPATSVGTITLDDGRYACLTND